MMNGISHKKNLTITVTDVSGSCGDVAQYQDGVSYQVGDEVTNIGHIFKNLIGKYFLLKKVNSLLLLLGSYTRLSCTLIN